MIFKFLNNDKEKPNVNSEAINIACLLIHAAKIDENYTTEEKEIIKKTVSKLYPDLDNLDEIVLKAEQKRTDYHVPWQVFVEELLIKKFHVAPAFSC